MYENSFWHELRNIKEEVICKEDIWKVEIIIEKWKWIKPADVNWRGNEEAGSSYDEVNQQETIESQEVSK